MPVSDQSRLDCVAYALGVMLGEDVPGDLLGTALAYGDPGSPSHASARLCIVPSRFFGPGYGTPASLPDLPLRDVEGVPLLYGTPEIRREGDRLVVHADVVASAFFLVTRYEELVRRDARDERGRFPGRQSLPWRAGFLGRPIVEEYGALLRRWLREAGVAVPEPRRRFSLLLTHDVDAPTKYPCRRAALRRAARALVGRGRIRKLPEALAVGLGLRRDPYDTFDELLRLDRAAASDGAGPQASSVYFFLARGRTRRDPRYPVSEDALRELILKVRRAGAEVGLHASYEAAVRPELLAEERAALEAICGFPIHRSRHHLLAFREIEDGWALAKAGLAWDSTLGYAGVAGFRLGVCHPIPLFDPVAMRPFGIEEHPLLVMEGSLSNPKHMGLDEEAAFETCRGLIRETRRHAGEFVALWHNSKLARDPGSYHWRLYPRLLRELRG